ncbi:hypothetical protein ACODT4_32830 [Streptomyces sp. 2.9]|uniref:hypothetical protein n=1 Tax=Streptomyces tritrimontium TaxID=3406573 RepID=UPI003BB515F3
MTTSAIFTAHGGTPPISPVRVRVRVRVRILLPEDHRHDPAHPYPVPYLRHGGPGDVEQWSKTDEGNVTASLKDRAVSHRYGPPRPPRPPVPTTGAPRAPS